jgi:hypothetical protein
MFAKDTTDDSSLDARLTFIRRQSALDSRAALFVLSPVDDNELQEFVRRFVILTSLLWNLIVVA